MYTTYVLHNDDDDEQMLISYYGNIRNSVSNIYIYICIYTTIIVTAFIIRIREYTCIYNKYFLETILSNNKLVTTYDAYIKKIIKALSI